MTNSKAAAPPKKATATRGVRGKKKVIEEEENEEEDEEEEENHIIMIDDEEEEAEEEEEEDDALFVRPTRTTKQPAPKRSTRAKSPAKKTTSRTSKQSTLSFSQASTQRNQPPTRAVAKSRKILEPVGLRPIRCVGALTDDEYRATMRYLMMTMPSSPFPRHVLQEGGRRWYIAVLKQMIA